MDEFISTIRSVECRREMAWRTHSLLQRVGLDPILLVQESAETSPAGSREQFRRALRLASEREKGLLFFEDDLLVSSRFPEALSLAMAYEYDVVSFYCHDLMFYPVRLKRVIAEGAPVREFELFEPRHLAVWYGSQAVMLRPHAIRRMLNFKEPDLKQYDLRLPEAGRMAAVFPNPIQHVGHVSTVRKHSRMHDSQSFGLIA